MSAEPQLPFEAGAIRGLREDLGMTQVEFAALLGVTPATVGRWERGDTVVQRRLQPRLAELAASSRSYDDAGELAPVHDIVSRQTWTPPRPDRLPSRREYVETLLIGLRNGHVAREDWAEVARFVGREFYDADWPTPEQTPEPTGQES